MTRILFVCSESRLRSPTAADVFSEFEGVETMCAGTNPDCVNPVTGALIEWADSIIVMEHAHKNILMKMFQDSLGDTPIHVLEIPDVFNYMDPMLVALLKARVTRYISME